MSLKEQFRAAMPADAHGDTTRTGMVSIGGSVAQRQEISSTLVIGSDTAGRLKALRKAAHSKPGAYAVKGYADGIVDGTRPQLEVISKNDLSQQTEDDDEPVDAVDEAPPQPAPKARRNRKSVKAAAPEPAPQPVHRNVNMSVKVDQLGVIPSQYHHVWCGEETVVLGVIDLSYVPAVLTAQVELSIRPNELYANTGYSFVDGDGIKNIIMIRMKQDGQKE